MEDYEKRRHRREMRSARHTMYALLITVAILAFISVMTLIVSSVQISSLSKRVAQIEHHIAMMEETVVDTGNSSPIQDPLPVVEESEVKETETEEEPVATEETESETETETETETEIEEDSDNNAIVTYKPKTVNYLAIGNSITRHSLSSYWWGDWGMAASTKDKDYFHLIKSKLEAQFGDVTAKAYNFYSWEPQGTDRAEALTLLDNYLSDQLNYVTIQLGENVSDTNTFENDFAELIRHIRERAPNAKIVIIGNFWTDATVDELKMRVAIANGLAMVDLSEIRDKAEYQCGMGTIVYGQDGEPHEVSHEGCAKHPNDAAMSYIADKTYDALINFGN